jgi:cytochrome c556
MKHPGNPVALVLAGAVLVLVACGQAPDGGAAGPQGAADVDVESSEYAAMEYRQGLMHVIAFKAGTLRDMADGNIPVDEETFVEFATDLAAVAGMIEEGFLAGSDSEALPGSNALPGIWANWNDFLERAATLQTAVQTVASQAQSGGFQAAQAAASEQIGPACGNCHREYRQRNE